MIPWRISETVLVRPRREKYTLGPHSASSDLAPADSIPITHSRRNMRLGTESITDKARIAMSPASHIHQPQHAAASTHPVGTALRLFWERVLK